MVSFGSILAYCLPMCNEGYTPEQIDHLGVNILHVLQDERARGDFQLYLEQEEGRELEQRLLQGWGFVNAVINGTEEFNEAKINLIIGDLNQVDINDFNLERIRNECQNEMEVAFQLFINQLG